MKLKNDNLKDGQIVWICDYRHNDIFKKPIRNIEPTKVRATDNKDNLPSNNTVYYSDTHFRPLKENGEVSSKIIAPYDNTGYRSYSGVCVNIFDNEKECLKCYKKQCETIIKEINEAKQKSIERFDSMLNEIESKIK